jgi:hypothetical protein
MFPFKHTFVDQQERELMFARLADRARPAVELREHSFDRYTFGSGLPLAQFRGRALVFVSADEDYRLMNELTDVYTEPQRMRGRLKFQPQCPLDQFDQDPVFRARLDVLSKDPGKGSKGNHARRLRDLIWKTTRECTQFKAVLAVDVLLFFRATRVLDPCAGWGDRLLAALAVSHVERYAAWDPNADLKPGHDAMIRDLTRQEPESYLPEKLCTVSYEAFETAELPAGETFDLVFTSPPFFDFEVYPGPDQSVARYPEFLDWFKSFLLASLAKAWAVLQDKGHMVIHLADVGNRQLCEPMCLWALAELPGCQYHGTLASVGRAEKPKPLFVFQKKSGETRNKAWARKQLTKLFASYGV